MERLYTVSKISPVANCGSDHELFIANFRLKSKKVGKTTRPLNCDLNQIPYDYTGELMNRLKKWDLIDKVPKELKCLMEVHNIVKEAVTKTFPKRNKRNKAK